MSDKSAIEWTDATWNPTTGCTKVSPACAHCYIERTPPFRIKGRKFVQGHIPLQLHDDKLGKPQTWKTPRRIFVNSLSDLFHADVPDTFIAEVWKTMATIRRHTYQVLTKRAERMAALLPRLVDTFGVLPNVWLGVSVENQHFADERIPLLLDTPAAIHFISAEPLLGPIDLSSPVLQADSDDYLHWVIAGGESGPKARLSHPDWFRSLRDQCVGAGVAFHFKQWGEWEPVAPIYGVDDERDGPRIALAREERCQIIDRTGETWPEWQPPTGAWMMERVGKKAAGRLLDGREWDECPVARS